MKTKILLSALLLSSFTFFGCGNDQANYTGYWKGEADMIFEVFTENNIDYTIRNVNGDLTAKYENNALRGKNSLNMDILMRVKGDSAYYEFGEDESGKIVTGYKRISKDEYDKIFKAQSEAKANYD
ncbi:MAG: hypothetical protein IKS96_09635 [Fibrobacter sp.]|jgi:hypothetical protein|nr:hypothetical protein [Fibrobacter sp.]